MVHWNGRLRKSFTRSHAKSTRQASREVWVPGDSKNCQGRGARSHWPWCGRRENSHVSRLIWSSHTHTTVWGSGVLKVHLLLRITCRTVQTLACPVVLMHIRVIGLCILQQETVNTLQHCVVPQIGPLQDKGQRSYTSTGVHGREISGQMDWQRGLQLGPSRSQDETPLNLFMWGYVWSDVDHYQIPKLKTARSVSCMRSCWHAPQNTIRSWTWTGRCPC